MANILVTKLINEQTIFYFSNEQVIEALAAYVKNQLPPDIKFKTTAITARSDKPDGRANGMTLTMQRVLQNHGQDHDGSKI